MSDSRQLIAPSGSTLNKCSELCADDPELLDYFREDLAFIVKKTKSIDQYANTLKVLDDQIELAEYRRDEIEKVDCWSGELSDLGRLKSSNINQLDFMAKSEFNKLNDDEKEQLLDVVFVYDISDDSKILRGYLCNGKQLNPEDIQDEKLISVLDKALHSWLYSHDMSYKDDILYKKSANNKSMVKVPPEELVNLFINEKEGLQDALKKLNPQIDLTVYKQGTGVVPTSGQESPEEGVQNITSQ